MEFSLRTTRGVLLSSVSALALTAACTGPFDSGGSCSTGLGFTLDEELTPEFNLNLECEFDNPVETDPESETEGDAKEIGEVADAPATTPHHFQADNVVYLFGPGTVRDLPVNHDLMATLSEIANDHMPPNTVVNVTSGGQVAIGQGSKRTGSTRHDVDEYGYGGSADFYITIDGKKVLPAQRPDLYAKIVFEAAKTQTGIGHYAWGIHVGGGPPAFWGPDTTAKTADPFFRDAYNRGRQAANS